MVCLRRNASLLAGFVTGFLRIGRPTTFGTSLLTRRRAELVSIKLAVKAKTVEVLMTLDTPLSCLKDVMLGSSKLQGVFQLVDCATTSDGNEQGATVEIELWGIRGGVEGIDPAMT